MYRVYMVLCWASGKRYVGVTRMELVARWVMHLHKAFVTREQGGLAEALREHGIDQFAVAEVVADLSKEDAEKMESGLISKFSSMAPNGYNRTSGGFRPLVVSDVSRERMRANNRGKWSEESKKKLSAALTGRKWSEERRKKWSEVQRSRRVVREV